VQPPEYMFLVPFRALQIFLLCKNISSPRILVLKSKNNTKDARMAFSADDVGSERCAQY
jgi:hypothetical protein